MNQTFLPHLATRVFGVPLLIQPEKLTVILEAIGPRLGMRDQMPIEGMPVLVNRPASDDDEEELEQELEATRTEFQAAIRNLEISSEEQKAVNEQALSVSEEYQSTNEELLIARATLRVIQGAPHPS